MNYLIKFSYDGSKFFGFQRLNEELSVQRELEKALTMINKNEVLISGAGRTDRGVHAVNQAASFSLKMNIPPGRLINAINSIVRPYININSCVLAGDDFHARYSVVKKNYEYRIYTGAYDPLLFDYYEFINDKLDINLMIDASKLFVGGHKFNNFVSGYRDNYDAIIDDIDIIVNGDFIKVNFIGKGFYRYMVRNIVGALIEVGKHKRTLEDIKLSLDNYDVEANFSTANAKGLYLIDVMYE